MGARHAVSGPATEASGTGRAPGAAGPRSGVRAVRRFPPAGSRPARAHRAVRGPPGGGGGARPGEGPPAASPVFGAAAGATGRAGVGCGAPAVCAPARGGRG
eukprot:8074467-Pyramimonas_sp.AAC.1